MTRPLQAFNATELQNRTQKVIETRTALEGARTTNAGAQQAAGAAQQAESDATSTARDAMKDLRDYLSTLDDLGDEPNAPTPDVNVTPTPEPVGPDVNPPDVAPTDEDGGGTEEPAPEGEESDEA